MQHLRSGALSSGHKCFKRARKLISANSDVCVDLKATVTKNTALLYKRAGVFDRAAELFRMAAEMEDGVANAPRRSAPRASSVSSISPHFNRSTARFACSHCIAPAPSIHFPAFKSSMQALPSCLLRPPTPPTATIWRQASARCRRC
jgi:hypothetical protein